MNNYSQDLILLVIKGMKFHLAVNDCTKNCLSHCNSCQISIALVGTDQHYLKRTVRRECIKQERIKPVKYRVETLFSLKTKVINKRSLSCNRF
jgi:hypothetical protein